MWSGAGDRPAEHSAARAASADQLLMSSELVGVPVGVARVLVPEASGQLDARDGRSRPAPLGPLAGCVGGASVRRGVNASPGAAALT